MGVFLISTSSVQVLTLHVYHEFLGVFIPHGANEVSQRKHRMGRKTLAKEIERELVHGLGIFIIPTHLYYLVVAIHSFSSDQYEREAERLQVLWVYPMLVECIRNVMLQKRPSCCPDHQRRRYAS